MQARTPAPPRPATEGGSETRLRWWALALPVLAFTALLTLILNPSDAHAAGPDPALTHLVQRAQSLLAR
ncbi:hypothetical protein KUM39_11970 [Streptomyces sp. J2-1]|uniref:hypothetical protein n=1 Tax=Streptomyces corallincola TaxID=2851888 RepID=UPI001C393DFA|nr:hypothetical protein [Streptomyces corallincola]MBV2355075.1 hypothetical protein [Streptomyces corallincola]